MTTHVRLLVGTKKGAFFFESDSSKWARLPSDEPWQS